MKIMYAAVLGVVMVLSNNVLAADNGAVRLRQAAGKTTLSAEDCGAKAKQALSSMRLEKIDVNISLSDWKKVESPTKDTPRTAQGTDGSTQYSIFCRIFESDIVLFTVAGKDADRLKEMWDIFYKN